MVTPPPETLFLDIADDLTKKAFSQALATEKSVALTDTAQGATYKITMQATTPAIPVTTDIGNWLKGGSLHGYRDKGGRITAIIFWPESGSASLQSFFTPPSADIQEAVEALCKTHGIYGPWSIHPAHASGGHALINAPYIPLMPLFAGLGLNWAALMAYEAMGRRVSALLQSLEGTASADNTGAAIFIPASDIYLDMDDTLIIHGALYGGAQKLINHARQAGKRLHLITRHYREPALTLAEYGLREGDFTSVIWITDETPKSAFIKGDQPVFIDDAFRERQEVSQSLGVPALPAEAAGLINVAF